MLKKISKSAIYVMAAMVVIAMVFGFTNNAVIKAAAEPSVIGVVDSTSIQEVYPAFVTAVNNILNEKTRLENELYQKAASLDSATQAKLQEEYNKKYNDYAQSQLTPVQKKFSDTIVAVAKEKGVNVVLDSSSVYYGGIDITSAVKTKLGIK